jgi:hypothetical protein
MLAVMIYFKSFLSLTLWLQILCTYRIQRRELLTVGLYTHQGRGGPLSASRFDILLTVKVP